MYIFNIVCKKRNLIFILCLFCFVSSFGQQKQLQDYISLGLDNSPLLKDLKNQQSVNLIDSLKILAGYQAQVNGVGTSSFSPSSNGWGYDYAVTNGTNFAQQVIATKKLVSKENLANQHEAIRLLNTSLNISGKISAQDLSKSITAQYITAYGVHQQIIFNQGVMDLLKKQVAILKVYTEKGIYKQTDYLNFIITTQQQEILNEQLAAQYQNEIASLNYLCGIKDTARVLLADPTLKIEPLAEKESTIYYQPFIVDSFKLKNNIAQVEYSYKPKLNLYADGGFLSSFSYMGYKNFGASAGISLTVPIYDGHQKKMQVNKIKIAEQTRQVYRDFFKKQFDQQNIQLLQQLNATNKVIAQADKQIVLIETLIDANKKLLEIGEAKITDYILAINAYLNTKNTITQNSINKLQIINQINYWNKK
jgi:outer membrane protein TolC